MTKSNIIELKDTLENEFKDTLETDSGTHYSQSCYSGSYKC
ncbi:hypothetical protein ACP8HZ_10655 [Francisella noatunensis]